VDEAALVRRHLRQGHEDDGGRALPDVQGLAAESAVDGEMGSREQGGLLSGQTGQVRGEIICRDLL